MGAESDNWHLELTNDQWVAQSVSGPRPPARYKVFDLKTLAWSTLNLNTESNADKIKDSLLQEVLPATSGHRMIKWGNKLLLLGGHSKYISDSVTVQFIDLESHQSGVMETTGKVPVSRSGQSVTLVGSRLIMFGGEDLHRQLMNDVHVLDLETMTWDILETTGSLYLLIHRADAGEVLDQRRRLRMALDVVCNGESIMMLQSELKHQKKLVRSLKKKSLWAKSLEEVVEKLVDIVSFIHQEILEAFGDNGLILVGKEPVNKPERLGVAGLALHYANVINQIDNITSRPTSLPPNMRDQLYHGLPNSVKVALRSRCQTVDAKEEE